MKNNITRALVGLVSSLFLAVGFARAAEQLDPLNSQKSNGQVLSVSAMPCGQEVCNIIAESPAPSRDEVK